MCNAPTMRPLCRALTLATIVLTGYVPAIAQFDFGGFGGSRGGNDEKVSVEAQFTAATDERPALLFVTAKIADEFHVYAVDQGNLPDGGGGPMPTSITLAPDSAARVVGDWQPLAPPDSHPDEEIWIGLELREHHDEVTWFAPIEFAAGTDPASLKLIGRIEGQACNPQTCIPFESELSAQQGEGFDLPPNTTFASSPVAPKATQSIDAAKPQTQTAPTPPPTAPQQTAPSSASGTLYDLSQVSLTASAEGSLLYYLLTAFLGGIILNVMPCVLPVIGLKVMSFVQQAGQSRAHAFALNCWYSAGIVFVFLGLATMAVTLQLGWGGQFGSAGFNITLIGIVFAMALSLMGMWEIPIPGFIGSGAAVEITEREGPTAAFLKGILTTLLATPCTGPLMATALAWSVKQPAWMTYSVFGALGLGMASPFLLVGAFPSLVRFLPKPGAWMETFKKIMGLVLLATVVWFLTFIEAPLVVPTVALMVGIAAGCWWVSQTPITAPLDQKVYGWITAVMIIIIAAMSAYGWLYRDVMKPRFEKAIARQAEQQIGEQRLRIARDLSRIGSLPQLQMYAKDLDISSKVGDGAWQSFSLSKLGQLTLGDGRTVLVDFTADWCLNCKTLERLVLKTQPVLEAITSADVVTMEADYTKRPAEIDRTIKTLGGVGVPLIAIFPGNDPYHPIVFSDGQYTKSGLIEAIAQATGRNDLLPGKSGSSAALSQSASSERR